MQLEQAFCGTMAGTLISVEMASPDKSEGFASQYLSMLDKQCPANTLLDSNYYAMVKSARTITSYIGALAGCAVGTALSYPVLPGLASMFAAQTGMRWEYGFSWPAAGLTFLIVCGASGAVALASYVRIRKLPPMAALRTGLAPWHHH